MRNEIFGLMLLSAAVCAGCGADIDESAENGAPPAVADPDDDRLGLESGTYYVTDVRDLQDGCRKEPMNSQDPLTQVPFTLANDGAGKVQIDFCIYDASSVVGSVRGKAGVLAVAHSNRRRGAAEFDQECRIEMRLVADNRFFGRYRETQRHRNQALRDATGVNAAECQTSFDFHMEKRQD